MAAATVHPSEQTLQSYGLGKLDDLLAEAVGKHLAECDSCRTRVAELTSDTFLGRLQEVQARPASIPPVGSSLPGMSKLDGDYRTSPPPAASTLPPGLAEHPDYEVLRELGRGGMGVVYLARNKLMGRNEVLKVVGGHLLERPGVAERFLREIRSAAMLHHTNIVTAYSVLRVGQSLVFAMEYVEGYDLAQLVKGRGPLRVDQACNFIHQAALGLQYASAKGMVHRDIKPSNLILAREGKKPVVKVLDFGLSKVTSEGQGQGEGGLTREGQMLGTPDYIAPEQIRDAQSADIRADIYSLGCTLYCLLAGRPPFRGDNLWDLYQAHFSMNASPLNLLRPEVPAELAALVAKMMAKDPKRRFQTPGEVAEALKPFFKPAASRPSGSSPEVSRINPPAPPMQTPVVGPAPAQPATPATAPTTPVRKSSKTGAEGVAWESLIDVKEDEELPQVVKRKLAEPKPVPAEGPIRRPPWVWPAVAALALLLGLFAVLGIVLWVKTSNGIIELVNLPEDADVFVDGEKVSVVLPKEGKPAVITVTAGKHRIKVEKDGLDAPDEDVTVQAGGKAPFTIRLLPLAGSHLGKEDVDDTSVRSVDRKDDRPESEPGAAGTGSLRAESNKEAIPRHVDFARTLPPDGFVPLFNGRDLRGWKTHPDRPGNWRVEKGILVGSGPPVGNLYSDGSNYKNFHLRVEARCSPSANSGVLFPISFGGNWNDEYEVGLGNSTGVLLVRSKIDPGFTGSRDSPLDWFDLEVIADGNHIVSKVNGQTVTDSTEEHEPSSSGHIALELCDTQTRIEFRKIEIKELHPVGQHPPAGVPLGAAVATTAFVRLFNGKDLAGWAPYGERRELTITEGSQIWKVRDGVLHGSGSPSLLFSPRGDYLNFRVRAQVKINDGGYSGLYFRTAKGPGFARGYEAQINSTGRDPNKSGSLYRPPQPPIGVSSSPVPPDTWFTLEVEAIGRHIRVWVDHAVTVDWVDPQETHRQGHFAIQVHDPLTQVQIRNLEVIELDLTGKPIASREAKGNQSDATGRVDRKDVSFDGRTRLTVAKSEDFNMTNRDYTIFARIKTGHDGTIFSKTAPEGRWVPDGKRLFILDGKLTFDIGWVRWIMTNSKINDDLWHEIAMVYTHVDDRVLLFIDGKADGEGAVAPKTDAQDHVIRIGYTAFNVSPSHNYFRGRIGEVRFYQQALGIREIAALATKEPAGDPAVARWKLDPVQGTSIHDETGHGHEGKLERSGG